MVSQANLTVYSTRKKDNLTCDIMLSSKGNSSIITFDTFGFQLTICLKDVVDIEDFNNLLNGKEKRSILHCTLIHNGKEYKGLRKVTIKDKKVAVSLGGIRIEVDSHTKDELIELVKAIKIKLGL